MIAIPSLVRLWPNHGNDYYQFWVAGQALKELPIKNIYEWSDRKLIGDEFRKRAVASKSKSQIKSSKVHEGPEFAGTPFFYACIYLISTTNYERSHHIFLLVSYSCFVVALFILLHLSRNGPFLTTIQFLFFTTLFWPLKRDLQLGNVTQIQLFQLSVIFLLVKYMPQRAAHIWIGLILGLSVFFKPTFIYAMATFLILLLAKKSWANLRQFTVGFILSCPIALLMPTLLFGIKCNWWSWAQSLSEIALTNYYLKDSFLNIISGGTIEYFHELALMVWLILLFALMRYRFNLKKSSKQTNTPFEPEHGEQSNFIEVISIINNGLMLLLLTSPLIHGQYFLLCIPPIIFGMRWALLNNQLVWTNVALCLLACILISSSPVTLWHGTSKLPLLLRNYLAAIILMASSLLSSLTRKSGSIHLERPYEP